MKDIGQQLPNQITELFETKMRVLCRGIRTFLAVLTVVLQPHGKLYP